MAKPKTHSDPSPSEKFVPITSAPTEAEQFIAKKYEPTGGDVVTSITSFIIRAAVDMARYKRSLINHPEKSEHYERLIRTAAFAAQTRVVNTCQEMGIHTIDSVATELAGINWEFAPDVPVPEVRTVSDPYDVTVVPRELHFSRQVNVDRKALPA